MLRVCAFVCPVVLLVSTCRLLADEPAAGDQPPRSVDQRLEIRLVAEHPKLVTPTGIDVDPLGRIWVIESNTHFTPEKYQGHTTDRLLVLEDTDGDGSADRIETYADGFKHAMSVAVRPGRAVYVVTRREVLLLTDKDDDLKPESRERILFLDTPGDYPHNGLAGLAFDALGNMYVGLGENLGAPYKVIGSDGRKLSGEGEGGSLYRCRLNGRSLERVATGFWNPHASCVDGFGRIFSVDNDPDSRPPCRLLHIIEGGDYGYRFRNGRRGLHPFTSWDGELPGTLPMVAGTGEAPSGIVAYESDGLPAEYIGNLLVTSWGDHRIDRFQLKPKGSSFTSTAEPLIVGGQNFRPVGIAVAPDGSLVCSDWVLRDYSVHGQGRVWRISAVNPPRRKVIDMKELATKPVEELKRHLESPRLEVRRTAAQALAEHDDQLKPVRNALGDKNLSARARIEAYWAWERNLPLIRQKLQETATKFPEQSFEWQRAYLDDEVATESDHRHNLPIIPFEEADEERGLSKYLENLRQPRTRDHLYPLACLPGNIREWIKSRSDRLSQLFDITDPFVFAEAVRSSAESATAIEISDLIELDKHLSTRARLGLLLATRRQNGLNARMKVVPLGLADPDPGVKRATVQWVGEEKFTEYRPQVEKVLDGPDVTPDLLEAVLATFELLDGVRRDPKFEGSGAGHLINLLDNSQRPAALRVMSLRLLPPEHPGFTAELARKLFIEKDEALRLEAVRAVTWSRLPEREEFLRGVAADEQAAVELRTEAISGLVGAHPVSKDAATALTQLLSELLDSPERALRITSLRALRTLAAGNEVANAALLNAAEQHAAKLAAWQKDDAAHEFSDLLKLALEGLNLPVPAEIANGSTPRPADPDAWLAASEKGGDAVEGRRVFFDAGGAGCVRCHTVRDRGARIGPELSTIARTLDRRKLAESILFPSKEVAPQFVAWSIVMRDGRVYNGLVVADREGKLRLGLSDGTLVDLPTAEIEERLPQQTSIMPDKLVERMTAGEMRDLLAYLQTLK